MWSLSPDAPRFAALHAGRRASRASGKTKVAVIDGRVKMRVDAAAADAFADADAGAAATTPAPPEALSGS